MVTQEQVEKIQNIWGDGVVKIGALKHDRKECEKFASEFLDNLYAFDKGKVLFKPTKCEKEQFCLRNLKLSLILFQGMTGPVMRTRALQYSPGQK